MLEHLLRKLESFCAFSEVERQAVRGMFTGSRRVAAGEDILQEGAAATTVSLLLEGIACRYKSLPDGQRQIMSFHIPGDLVDLHAFILGEADHSIGCLTPCRLAFAPYQGLEEVIDQHPAVARALWRDTAIDGAVWREWLVGMGRRSAYSRIAHLLCEVVARLKDVGLMEGQSCDLQLTQQELADSLGLSLVHVNRVLQRLRANGLISLGRGTLRVHDWEGLKQAGGFDVSYLRPRQARAA
jgi:CRP-like cAMP-binding protein